MKAKKIYALLLTGTLLCSCFLSAGCEKKPAATADSGTESNSDLPGNTVDKTVDKTLALPGDGADNKTPDTGDRSFLGTISDSLDYIINDIVAQTVRTGYQDEAEGAQTVFCFTNPAELITYYENNKVAYWMDLPHEYNADSFADVIKAYDDKFFEEKDLIMARVTAGSGSVVYKALGIYFGKDDEGKNFLAPVIDSHTPEVVTWDMACWHIFIEIDKKYKASEYEIRNTLHPVWSPVENPIGTEKRKDSLVP